MSVVHSRETCTWKFTAVGTLWQNLGKLNSDQIPLPTNDFREAGAVSFKRIVPGQVTILQKKVTHSIIYGQHKFELRSDTKKIEDKDVGVQRRGNQSGSWGVIKKNTI